MLATWGAVYTLLLWGSSNSGISSTNNFEANMNVHEKAASCVDFTRRRVYYCLSPQNVRVIYVTVTPLFRSRPTHDQGFRRFMTLLTLPDLRSSWQVQKCRRSGHLGRWGVVHRHAPDPAASLLPLGAKGRREVVCKPIFFYIFHLQLYKESHTQTHHT